MGHDASLFHDLADFHDDSAVADAHDDGGHDQDDEEKVEFDRTPPNFAVNVPNAPIAFVLVTNF